jgi:hypothetical protein
MIEQEHGEKEARKLFARYGRDLTPTDIRERKNIELVMKFLDMPEEKRDRQKLAETLAKENETRPREKRYGPRGSTSVVAMRRQIDRVLDNKAYCDEANFSVTFRWRAIPFPGESC